MMGSAFSMVVGGRDKLGGSERRPSLRYFVSRGGFIESNAPGAQPLLGNSPRASTREAIFVSSAAVYLLAMVRAHSCRLLNSCCVSPTHCRERMASMLLLDRTSPRLSNREDIYC
eukprot:scaffold18204_cov30-Tisochrysis_lutea.AAC.1